jgi:hypothetical protein
MATSAKQSAIDTLHRLYVAQLTLELKSGNPNAAILAVIGNFLKSSGTRATNDSPTMQRLAQSYAALPFTADETPAITHEKAQH